MKKTGMSERPAERYKELDVHLTVEEPPAPHQYVPKPELVPSLFKLRLDRIAQPEDDQSISHRSAFESVRASNRSKITPRPPGSNAPNSHRTKYTSINTSLVSEESSVLEKLIEIWENQEKEHANISMTKSVDGWKSEFDSDEDNSHVNPEDVKRAIGVLRKANLLDADFLGKMNEILIEPNASSNLELLLQVLSLDKKPTISTVKEEDSCELGSSEEISLHDVTLEDLLKAGRYKEAIKKLELSAAGKSSENPTAASPNTGKPPHLYQFDSPKLPQSTRQQRIFDYHQTGSTDVPSLKSRSGFAANSSNDSKLLPESNSACVTPQKSEIASNF